MTLAIVPAAADARTKVIAPPGNSGLDQYVETIPDASGNRVAAQGRPPSLGTLGRALQSQGAAGRQTAQVLAITAPAHAVVRLRAFKPHADAPPAAGATEVANAGRSSFGDLSIALPILMGLSLLAAIAFAVARRRAEPAPPPDDDAP